MKSRLAWTVAAIAIVLVMTTTWYAGAQPAPGGRPPGAGGAVAGGFPGMMMMPGWPPAPTPVVVVADGIVYVACEGILRAYDAKTLQPMAQIVYWERARQQ